jgi:hypothetical protein
MPLVRIDLSKDAPPERVRVLSQAVYGAMVEIANVPAHDKFQIVTRHSVTRQNRAGAFPGAGAWIRRPSAQIRV